MLQKISVFLRDYDEGRFRTYRDLIRTVERVQSEQQVASAEEEDADRVGVRNP